MGIPEQLHIEPEGWILDLNLHSVLLVLSENEMAAADIEAGDMGQLPILLSNIGPDAEISSDILKGASVLVLEVCAAIPASIERFSAVRHTHPDLPVVAAVRNADLPLTRMLLKKGVRDVIGLPLVHAELVEILKTVGDEINSTIATDVSTGTLVTMMKSIGGVGATTVATHLASELAMQGTGRGTCIIDLDLQFGNAASYLGLSNELSIADLLAAGSRVDGQLLRSVASTSSRGLHVIAAPADIIPLEAANPDQILRIIELARTEFDHVVIDLPANWTNWTLSLVARSTAIFLVVELSVASLRQAKRQLQLFSAQGIGGSHVSIIANRIEKRLFRSIDLESAGLALGHSIDFSIHNDYPLVRAAHDQGVLIQEIRAKSKIQADITNILHRLGV